MLECCCWQHILVDRGLVMLSGVFSPKKCRIMKVWRNSMLERSEKSR